MGYFIQLGASTLIVRVCGSDLGVFDSPITSMNNRAMNGLIKKLPMTHPTTLLFLECAPTPTSTVKRIQKNMTIIINS
jgi:hypothetical protein